MMSEEVMSVLTPVVIENNHKLKPETEHVLLMQAARVSARNEEMVRATHDLLTELNPVNPVEHMLATQMVSCHNMAMEYGRLAMVKELPISVTEGYLNRSAKMMRLFGQHVDTLARLRNKGQQTIQVQHVHLNNVNQAIVGPVQHGG